MAKRKYTRGIWKYTRHGELVSSGNGDTIEVIAGVIPPELLNEDETQLIVYSNPYDMQLIQTAPKMYDLLESIVQMSVTGNIRTIKRKIREVLLEADTCRY